MARDTARPATTAVTVAPDTTAPDVSDTTPWTATSACCAATGLKSERLKRKTLIGTERNDSRMTVASPGKSMDDAWGRSPGSGDAAGGCSPLHLPRQRAEWLIEASVPSLQWRDRAGVAPDFPIEPDVGTRSDHRYITASDWPRRSPLSCATRAAADSRNPGSRPPGAVVGRSLVDGPTRRRALVCPASTRQLARGGPVRVTRAGCSRSARPAWSTVT